MPTVYIPHGGGPCFFADGVVGPPGAWNGMGNFLREMHETLPVPRALLVISAHWEMPRVTVTASPKPSLIYDYGGFPRHTYELKYPAPGSPELADRVCEVLRAGNIACAKDPVRGLDHGVFIPLLLAYPDADIPVLQLSLKSGLDPAEHISIGRALAPLRDEGVLIIGSGMSYHNMAASFVAPGRAVSDSAGFHRWLEAAVCASETEARERKLASWQDAPASRAVHPREEHLIPLMVVAGAGSGGPATRIYDGAVSGIEYSAFRFG